MPAWALCAKYKLEMRLPAKLGNWEPHFYPYIWGGCSSKFCKGERGGRLRKNQRGSPNEKKTTITRRSCVPKTGPWPDAADRDAGMEAAAPESDLAGNRRSRGPTAGADACGLVGRSDPDESAGQLGTAREKRTPNLRAVWANVATKRKAESDLANKRRARDHH